MRLFQRHSHAPRGVKRRASCWTSLGVAGTLLVGIPLLCAWRSYFDSSRADGVTSGHQRYRIDHSSSPTSTLEGRGRHLSSDCIEDIVTDSDEAASVVDIEAIALNHKSGSARWAVLIHIIVIAYMLLGLNTVCDLYFTGALDEMVNKWNVKPDVAGATFMAAGGSAPELFASLIGAVFSESDVGFSTIVGSAVFNVLFVIGLCGFSAQVPIKLTWWPLARDCTYYIIGLSVLAGFAKSGRSISIVEAIFLFMGYLGYCTIMFYNPQLEARFVSEKVDIEPMEPKIEDATSVLPVADTGSTECSPQDIFRVGRSCEAIGGSPSLHASHSTLGKEEKHHIKKSQPHFERRKTVNLDESGERRRSSSNEKDDIDEEKGQEKSRPSDVDSNGAGKNNEEVENAGDTSYVLEEADDEEEEDEIEELLLRPEESGPFVLWCLSLPIYGLLYYGIPKPNEKSFMLTFGVSLVWIAGFSFVLVYCVEILGAVLNIPITVMGFTLLAAGTSIPDLVSSMAVARAGEGDMAVSSSIGSNIFDILVGLPIPWIIKISIDAASNKCDVSVKIKSDYIVVYVLILIAMLFSVILSIHFLRWFLNKQLGVGMAILYTIFLITVLSIELTTPEALKF